MQIGFSAGCRTWLLVMACKHGYQGYLWAGRSPFRDVTKEPHATLRPPLACGSLDRSLRYWAEECRNEGQQDSYQNDGTNNLAPALTEPVTTALWLLYLFVLLLFGVVCRQWDLCHCGHFGVSCFVLNELGRAA